MQAISAPVHVKFRRKFCTVGVEFPGALSRWDLGNFSANFCPASLVLISGYRLKRECSRQEPEYTNSVSVCHLTKFLCLLSDNRISRGLQCFICYIVDIISSSERYERPTITSEPVLFSRVSFCLT
jgi:hypothetical protein